MGQTMDLNGIINTSMEHHGFLDQNLEMITLKVEDEKQGVEYSG